MAEIFIAGGGSSEESKDIDVLFRSSVLDRSAQPSCLYIPNAADTDDFSPMRKWFNETYPFFSEIITPEDFIKSDTIDSISDTIDSIYIGGGYNRTLMNFFASRGIDASFFLRFLSKDVTLYGGSAGAVVLGESLLTGREIMREPEKYKDLEKTGFNMCGGYSFCPHYDESNQSAIQALAQKEQLNIVRLHDRAGLVFDNGNIINTVNVRQEDIVMGRKNG